MLNGHSGSMSTGHANNPTDMLHRLETMMLMGIDLPLQAIQRQVASALDIIIHLGRLRDKTRKVLQIVEVEGYEDGRIQTKVLYEFKEEGMKNGKIQGWELDNYEVMNSRGVLKQEKLTEEGTLVKLTAVLRYDEEKMSCEFYAHLFSTPLSKKEGVLKKISQEVEKADQEQREKDYLILPDQVDGRKLSWKPVKEMRAFGILLLGGVMIVFQFTAEKQKQKEQRKKEIRQMQFDYPQLINKFSLYIGAGMTVRRAWIQIVKEYDKEKHYLGERTVYEEMRYTMNELKNGRPESECYEAFGRKCESPVYRKFGMLLSQNLRKGTKGLTNLLQREAQEAFEERKNMAKKLGEEAGTKLMIPLFLMLAVVFVIVTVPAFLTIQI